MICNRCLRAAARTGQYFVRSEVAIPSLSRSLHTTSVRTSASVSPSVNSAAPRSGSPSSSHQPPAATSTSAAQPFSTPLTPSPEAAGVEKGKAATSPVIALSSVPAGTPLKGLNFLKNKDDPVALEDHEYPSWLWDVLKKESKTADDKAEGDLFSKSKKQRRLAAKRLRKQALLHPEGLAPKVPIYEQSIDLPAGDGTVQGAKEAAKARDELRKAMRDKRRSKIKETNFLKTMG